MQGLTSLAMRLSAVEMARACGIEPDTWQQSVLQSRAHKILLNLHRQAGKTSVTAWLCLHTALYEPKSLSLMIAPSLRQSTEAFMKCLEVYRALGRPVPAEAENKLSLELENGSRIVSLPGKEATVRGMSGVRLIAADEASRIPSELLTAISPMLAVSGGRIICPSTPAGKRGWWHDAWTNGGDEWQRYQVMAKDCPRISKEFLASELRLLGPALYSQEYECAFVEDLYSIFPESYLERMISTEEHPWNIPPASWSQPAATAATLATPTNFPPLPAIERHYIQPWQGNQ